MKLRYLITDCTDPFTNLATEEYLTFHAEEDEMLLFLWQNANTVVIGKNQNVWRECRVEAMKAEGCKLARRMSGGGAVYHDLGNLNFTFIAREPHFDIPKQTEVILEAVRSLGISAVRNGRNDLTVGEAKFSGHAYYRSRGFCYHHGTLMMDVDPEPLTRYLSVSQEKLRSKGVKSVRSRVTNLKDHCPDLTKERMMDALLNAFVRVFAGRAKSLSPDEEFQSENTSSERLLQKLEPLPLPDPETNAELAALITRYASDEWRYGAKIPFNTEVSRRFPWGEVTIALHINEGHIRQAAIYSDSLETEIFGLIAERLTDLPYTRKALLDVYEDFTHSHTSDTNSYGTMNLYQGIVGDICSLLAKQIS